MCSFEFVNIYEMNVLNVLNSDIILCDSNDVTRKQLLPKV